MTLQGGNAVGEEREGQLLGIDIGLKLFKNIISDKSLIETRWCTDLLWFQLFSRAPLPLTRKSILVRPGQYILQHIWIQCDWQNCDQAPSELQQDVLPGQHCDRTTVQADAGLQKNVKITEKTYTSLFSKIMAPGNTSMQGVLFYLQGVCWHLNPEDESSSTRSNYLEGTPK